MLRRTYMGNDTPLYVEDHALQTIDKRQEYSAFGEQLIAPIMPQAAWRFDYGSTPNTRLYDTTTANGGTVTISESRARLQTSAANNGLARLATKARLRYLPGMGGLARFTAVFSTPQDNSTQLIGLGDTNDGFFFGYVGKTFGIIRRRDGVDNFVPTADWNGRPDNDRMDFNPQLGNIYQIRFQWLGYGVIDFSVADPDVPDRKFDLVHRILYPNTSADTSILNPTLPLFAEVQNDGNTSNIQLFTPSGLAAQEGRTGNFTHPLDVSNTAIGTKNISDTNINHLLTIRNKATFGGVANRVPLNIHDVLLSRANAGAPLSVFRLYLDATFGGALAYNDVDTNNSPVEYSTTDTTIVTGTARHIFGLSDNGNGNLLYPFDRTLRLYPGEQLTISVANSSADATLLGGVLNWLEEF